jgi:hypothetical protein
MRPGEIRLGIPFLIAVDPSVSWFYPGNTHQDHPKEAPALLILAIECIPYGRIETACDLPCTS